MDGSEAKRLRTLEEENRQLKHIVAEQAVDNLIYDTTPARVFMIMLHSPSWSPDGENHEIPPVGGQIDAVMANFMDRRVGFDVLGSPFGQLRDPNSYYALRHEDFKLEDLCDGYIYQKPFEQYEGVTPDPFFITDKNFNEAVQGIMNFEARSHYNSPKDFLRSMTELADIQAQFKAWGVTGIDARGK
jgi:hypothetical protein